MLKQRNQLNLENLSTQAIEIVKQAGHIIHNKFLNQNTVTAKTLANFVTTLDLEIEAFLVEQLQKLTPNCNFITEEAEQPPPNSTQPTWIIDPVDGTTNLVHKLPHIAISVALIADGEAQLGIIFNPLNDELFYAQRGKGAFLNKQKITVSNNKTLSQCLLSFGLPYKRDQAHLMFTVAEKVFATCHGLRRKGSAALDIAYIACGRLDAHFELTLQVWDFAAGALILQEAGGTISDWDNNPLPYVNGEKRVLATNGHIHQALLMLVSNTKV